MRERERLIARIRNLRRLAVTADARPSDPARDAEPSSRIGDPDLARVQGLEHRIAHLEQMVQGLQDSVHRESLRLSGRVADLEAQIQPGALSAALDKDARERGL